MPGAWSIILNVANKLQKTSRFDGKSEYTTRLCSACDFMHPVFGNILRQMRKNRISDDKIKGLIVERKPPPGLDCTIGSGITERPASSNQIRAHVDAKNAIRRNLLPEEPRKSTPTATKIQEMSTPMRAPPQCDAPLSRIVVEIIGFSERVLI